MNEGAAKKRVDALSTVADVAAFAAAGCFGAAAAICVVDWRYGLALAALRTRLPGARLCSYDYDMSKPLWAALGAAVSIMLFELVRARWCTREGPSLRFTAWRR